MKRIHRQAMRTARRLQDAYVDGDDSEDDAIEARDWHDEQEPAYQGGEPPQYDPNELIPF